MAELTRADILAAIADGNMWHHPAGNGSTWPTDRINTPTGSRLIQPSWRMFSIEKNGYATHPHCGTNTGRVPWTLTEQGQEALNAATRKEN